MRRAERVHPIITCPQPLPFGWGDGEPPTPEDKHEETKSPPTVAPNPAYKEKSSTIKL